MSNKEVQFGNKVSYIEDGIEIIAEHLTEVHLIDDIIRTNIAKTLDRMMQAPQGQDGFELRIRYRVENEFYKKLHTKIKEIRKKRK